MIFSFDPPLEHGGARYETLTLGEPLVSQVLAAEKVRSAESGQHATHLRDMALIAEVAGVDLDVVRKFPMPIMTGARKFVKGFLSAEKREAASHVPESECCIDVEPPIEKHNRRLDVLELRPPTAGDLEAAQREVDAQMSELSVLKFQVVLVSRCAGIPRSHIEALRISTLHEASRYVTGFI